MSQANLIWSCPVCQGGLTLLDKTITCAAGHSFDRAKQGYFNLLLANQKGSANPGDDMDMLSSRREFLAAGHFSPLADALGNSLLELARNSESEDFQLLDTGCGEGYYLAGLQQRLQRELPELRVGYAGSDISKEAAKLAARLHKGIEWSVASSFNLPVDNRSVDVLLRVFAPGDIEEVARVLKLNGHFLRVVPGAEHLHELKDALYDEVTLHELQPTPEGFSELSATEIRFDVELNDNASVQQLLTMTPFLWRGKREAREALQQAKNLKVGAHFVVQLYSLNEAPELPANTPAPSLEQLQVKREALQEKHAEKLKRQAEVLAAKQEKERLAEVAKEKAAAFHWGTSDKVANKSQDTVLETVTDVEKPEVKTSVTVQPIMAKAIISEKAVTDKAGTESVVKSKPIADKSAAKPKVAFDWGTSSKVADVPPAAPVSTVEASSLSKPNQEHPKQDEPAVKPKAVFGWSTATKSVGEVEKTPVTIPVQTPSPVVAESAVETAIADETPAAVQPVIQAEVAAVVEEAEPAVEKAKPIIETAKPVADEPKPAVEKSAELSKPAFNKAAFSFAPRTASEEKQVAEKKLEKEVEKQVDEDVSSFLNEFVGRKDSGVKPSVDKAATAPKVSEPLESHEEQAGKKAAKEKFNDKGFSF